MILLAPVGALRYHNQRMERLRQVNRLSEIERSLEITGAIQTGFLPQEIHHRRPGVEVLSLYLPADKASGDWWWYQELADGCDCVMVADVTGHGPGPAILTASMATAFRVQDLVGADLETRLRHVNRELRRVSPDHFITGTALELHLATGRMKVMSLGGVPAAPVDTNGKVVAVGRPGTPLGSPTFQPGGVEGSLTGRARLVLYSDGLPDMRPPDGSELGKKRTRAILAATRGQELEAAMRHIRQQIDFARSGTTLNDDITVVIVTPAPASPQSSA